MLSFEQARKFAKDALKGCPNVFEHSEAVAQLAWETAKAINARHSHLKVDAERARLLGLLHDVGHAVSHGEDHALHSRILLEKIGEHELGRSVGRHGFSFEFSRGDPDFKPQTLEEKIMDYADCSCAGSRRVSYAERVRDWRERHAGKPDFELGNSAFVRVSAEIREIKELLE